MQFFRKRAKKEQISTKYLKIWAKMYKIWKYFEKLQTHGCNSRMHETARICPEHPISFTNFVMYGFWVCSLIELEGFTIFYVFTRSYLFLSFKFMFLNKWTFKISWNNLDTFSMNYPLPCLSKAASPTLES